MSWEISHTQDAWTCFRRGLEAQTDEWLREAIATCRADRQEELDKAFASACFDCDVDDSDMELPSWSDIYRKELEKLADVEDLLLVDEAQAWCEHNNTCSNGGFDFYVDNGGYYSICLSDYEEEEDDD